MIVVVVLKLEEKKAADEFKKQVAEARKWQEAGVRSCRSRMRSAQLCIGRPTRPIERPSATGSTKEGEAQKHPRKGAAQFGGFLSWSLDCTTPLHGLRLNGHWATCAGRYERLGQDAERQRKYGAKLKKKHLETPRRPQTEVQPQ